MTAASRCAAPTTPGANPTKLFVTESAGNQQKNFPTAISFTLELMLQNIFNVNNVWHRLYKKSFITFRPETNVIKHFGVIYL
jgi:hypothetical protein